MCPKLCIVDATGHGTREARTYTAVVGVRMCPNRCAVYATGHGTAVARAFMGEQLTRSLSVVERKKNRRINKWQIKLNQNKTK